MKFAVCLLALVSVAFGAVIGDRNEVAKRQTTEDSVPVNVAAMVDANGDIKPFDSKNVFLKGNPQ